MEVTCHGSVEGDGEGRKFHQDHHIATSVRQKQIVFNQLWETAHPKVFPTLMHRITCFMGPSDVTLGNSVGKTV